MSLHAAGLAATLVLSAGFVCGQDDAVPPATAVPAIAKSADEPPARVVTNSIGMKLTRIPAGEFFMGSADSDPGAREDEKPQHRVRISKPFYMGVYEVTQAEF